MEQIIQLAATLGGPFGAIMLALYIFERREAVKREDKYQEAMIAGASALTKVSTALDRLERIMGGGP